MSSTPQCALGQAASAQHLFAAGGRRRLRPPGGDEEEDADAGAVAAAAAARASRMGETRGEGVEETCESPEAADESVRCRASAEGSSSSSERDMMARRAGRGESARAA